MPAEAGIQAVGEKNNFKNLDSRFRGNDGIFPILTQPLIKEGLAKPEFSAIHPANYGTFRPMSKMNSKARYSAFFFLIRSALIGENLRPIIKVC